MQKVILELRVIFLSRYIVLNALIHLYINIDNEMLKVKLDDYVKVILNIVLYVQFF